MKKKKVLVTGGSGFIGSHLVKRLLKEGAEVAVSARYGNIVKNERLKEVWDDITIVEADLRNRGALLQIKDFKPTLIFHMAAYNHVGSSFKQVEECWDVNSKGTANLLDTITWDIEKFIYTSTSEVYGFQESVPFVESMNVQPMSPYAITKYGGELYARMLQRMRSRLPIVILRPFNTFGPYQSSKAIIPELIEKCLKGLPICTTKGEQTREFNYVENIVDGFIAAAQTTKNIDGPINLCSAEEIRICDLVTTIHRLTESKSKLEIGKYDYRPNEIWRMYADNSRAKSILEWTPKINVEEGLRRTVKWYRQYLELQQNTNKAAA